MKPAVRRKQILQLLKHSREPLTGNFLAKKFGISRQVIVGDISTLRSQGESVIATPEGYLYEQVQAASTVYKVFHTNEQTEKELRLIVSLGGGIVDVMVRHRIYGILSAQLSIYTEDDIVRFMEEIRLGKSVPLLNVTSGYHYHTVVAKDQSTLQKIKQGLQKAGFLIEQENENEILHGN